MTLLRYAAISAVGLVFFSPLRADDQTLVSSPAVALDQKLRSIVVSIDFSNAKVDQAIGALAALSKELDPEHVGVQFVIQPEASTSAKLITLKLDKVPLKVALRYMCELAYTNYKINEHSVYITPRAQFDGELVKRTFQVDPSFVEAATNAGLLPATKTP